MTLRQLTVRDFRNLVSLDLEIPDTGVVIIGDNGQGKTNLLEAIYYLVLFRSLRGARDRELVRFGQAGFFVAGDTGTRVQTGYQLSGRRKKVTVDGAEVSKLADAVGKFVAIPFSPDDREIISGGPGLRRRYMDVLLSLGESGYLAQLTALRAALKQRNAALRRGRPGEAVAFDGAFAAAAEFVITARRRWVAAWRERYRELCQRLGEQAEPDVEYRPRGESALTAAEIADELERSLDRDAATGTTTWGPHRHDLRVLLGGKEARHFGSAGQQRTAAIALRLLEAEALRQKNGATPVGLYDDVFAELDDGRQQRLLEVIGEVLPGQAILAAPRDAEVPQELFNRPRWVMKGGRIES